MVLTIGSTFFFKQNFNKMNTIRTIVKNHSNNKHIYQNDVFQYYRLHELVYLVTQII